MTIIFKEPLPNGAYKNQSGTFKTIPDGWAEVPEQFIPVWGQHKPFVSIGIEAGQIIAMEDNADARTAQEAVDAAAETEPSAEDAMMSMLVDHEYRLMLQELGV